MYLVSDGSSRPYRCKIKAPGFAHLVCNCSERNNPELRSSYYSYNMYISCPKALLLPLCNNICLSYQKLGCYPYGIICVCLIQNSVITLMKGTLVVQWVKRWPTDLAVSSSSPTGGKIFSTVEGVPLLTVFHYYLPIILI